MLKTQTTTTAPNRFLASPECADASSALGNSGRTIEYLAERRSPPFGGFAQGVFLAASLTAPVSYTQEPPQLFPTAAHTIATRPEVGKRRISLEAARLNALAVLAATEARLWKERADEAQFLSGSLD